MALCGEDSHAHIFTSRTRIGEADGVTLLSNNRPTAIVEVLDPMVLGSKVKDVCECVCNDGALQIPGCVRDLYEEELVLSGDKRRLFVTLGQFSIIRLERDAQLVVPVLDYAIPARACCDDGCSAEDPCELFSRIPFPAQQFSPTGCDSHCGDKASPYKTTAD